MNLKLKPKLKLLLPVVVFGSSAASLTQVVACGETSSKILTPEEFSWSLLGSSSRHVWDVDFVNNIKNGLFYDIENKTAGNFGQAWSWKATDYHSGYLPIGFKLPEVIETLDMVAFSHTAIPEGVFMQSNIKKVGYGAFSQMFQPLPKSFHFENPNVEFAPYVFNGTILSEGFTVPLNAQATPDAYDTPFLFAKLPAGMKWFDRNGKAMLTDQDGNLLIKNVYAYDWDAHVKAYYLTTPNFDRTKIEFFRGASVHPSNWVKPESAAV